MRNRKKASILILFSLLVSSSAYKGKIYTLVKNNLLTFRKKKNPHEVLKKNVHRRVDDFKQMITSYQSSFSILIRLTASTVSATLGKKYKLRCEITGFVIVKQQLAH